MTYSESLKVIHRQLVAAEMEDSILEHATMTVAVGLLVNAVLQTP
jgi:hypothetical protein